MTVTQALERIFAILAMAAALGAVALWAGRFVGRSNPAVAQIVEQFGGARFWLGALVAAVCMGGSLYFSLGAHFVPCRLCWIQRGFMYPLAFLLAWAGWRRWAGVRPIALAMAMLGGAVSVYHVILEHNPQLESNVCDVSTPCTQIWFKEFGFVTLPVMALCGFTFIASVLALPRMIGPRSIPTLTEQP
jgi:disulfide bond formation protein DsbB